MEKVEFAKMMGQVKFHASIMVKGVTRTLYGALVAGLICIAVYGFVQLTSEAGYTAVCDFIASTATLVVAFCNIYVMGGKKRGAKK